MEQQESPPERHQLQLLRRAAEGELAECVRRGPPAQLVRRPQDGYRQANSPTTADSGQEDDGDVRCEAEYYQRPDYPRIEQEHRANHPSRHRLMLTRVLVEQELILMKKTI
ncbi:Os04g0150500 [Oryza sativa Japonica Group]|uniref:Os04g0150500 protein n=1 Tax=Oryza sativa subsp. japonica TaxID=39947 RepID=A0A0P0W7E0_ORYSJ|nr:Os04g0150500 [Oryza sativa Japonica Group]